MPGELRARALVGRDEELAEVRAALAALARGEGGLLLVTGEAGVGKSRLLAEVRSYADEAGAAVLPGRAVPGSAPLRPLSEALLAGYRGRPVPDAGSLRPFRAALGRLLPAWAPTDATGGARGPDHGVDAPVVLGEAVLELAAATGPPAGTVLAVEDLHWADPDTMAVLDHLSVAAAAGPLLVVATARADEPGSALGHRSLAAARRVELARLPSAAAAAVALDCAHGHPLPPDVLEFVLAKADGLPLLVEEVLAGLVESGALVTGAEWARSGELVAAVPAGLRHLVQTRLDRLDPTSRTVVEALAVGGPDVGWRVVAAALDLDQAAVVAAMRAAVDLHLLTTSDRVAGMADDVVDESGGLTWRHDLTREAVLALVLPPERQRLAGALADALAGAGEPGRPWSLVAELRLAAGQPGAAAAALLTEAEQALRRGEAAAAVTLLERARTLDPAPPVVRTLVAALTTVGRASDALDAGRPSLATTAGEDHARFCLALARAAVTADRWDDARDLVDRSGLAGDPDADAVAADAAFGAGDVVEAERLARAVLAHPAAAALARCEAWEVLGRCTRVTDLPAAGEQFAAAAQVAAEHGLVAARVRALHSLGTVQLALTGASAALAEARDLAESAGLLATVAAADLVLAEATLLAEGPAAGAAAATRAQELAVRLGLQDVGAGSALMRAWALALGGDRAGAERDLEVVAPLAAQVPDVAAMTDVVRAVHPLLAGDLEGALDRLDPAMAVLARNRAGAPVAAWGLWVLLGTVLADPDAAGRRQRVLRDSHASIAGTNRAGLLLAEAVSAGRAGDPAEAERRHAQGEALLADQPWWRRLLRLLLWRAALADGWGDPVGGLRADLSGHEAAAAGDRLTAGDEALARACRDLLRGAGVTVRRGRSSTPVPPELRAMGVTAREAEVLGQVVDGLTNAEVARRLHLSVRTVDHHVANLLAKTGAANRAGLSRWAPTPSTPRTP